MNYVGLIVLVAVVLAIWNAAYKTGKREGSRKGYGVGFGRGKRARQNTGCLMMIVGIGIALACLGNLIASGSL